MSYHYALSLHFSLVHVQVAFLPTFFVPLAGNTRERKRYTECATFIFVYACVCVGVCFVLCHLMGKVYRKKGNALLYPFCLSAEAHEDGFVCHTHSASKWSVWQICQCQLRKKIYLQQDDH